MGRGSQAIISAKLLDSDDISVDILVYQLISFSGEGFYLCKIILCGA